MRKLLAVLAVTTLTAGVGVVAMGGAPTGAAETSGYTVVWGTGSGCSLATIDLTTAFVVPLPASSPQACVRDLAMSPDGVVYGIREPLLTDLAVELVRFDTTTGAATTLGPITGPFDTTIANNGGIAFAPDGTLLATFAANENGCVPSASTCLFRVDRTTLVATLIGPAGRQSDNPYFYLAASCAGSVLSSEFVESAVESDGAVSAANGLFDQQLTSWNSSTGTATRGAELPPNFDVGALEYDRVAGTLYALGLEVNGNSTPGPDSANPQLFAGASLYTIDPATGAATIVATVPDTELVVDSLAIPGTCAAPAAVELQPRFTG